MSGARRAALTELVTRLRTITQDNDFNTDAGALVFIGEEPLLGDGDPDEAIAVVVGESEPGHQGEHVVERLPIQVQAIVKDSVAGPWMAIEKIIEDIKTAVETDRTLGGALLPRGLERGSTRALDREPGSVTVGAGLEYRLTYAEEWGAP